MQPPGGGYLHRRRDGGTKGLLVPTTWGAGFLGGPWASAFGTLQGKDRAEGSRSDPVTVLTHSCVGAVYGGSLQ